MADKDYGTIVKGGKDQWTVVLTDDGGWAAGSDAWTWEMFIAPEDAPIIGLLQIVATSATITTTTATDDTMTLVFDLTNVDSALLTPGKMRVEIAGTDTDEVTYYDCVHGYFKCRLPEGAEEAAP